MSEIAEAIDTYWKSLTHVQRAIVSRKWIEHCYLAGVAYARAEERKKCTDAMCESCICRLEHDKGCQCCNDE